MSYSKKLNSIFIVIITSLIILFLFSRMVPKSSNTLISSKELKSIQNSLVTKANGLNINNLNLKSINGNKKKIVLEFTHNSFNGKDTFYSIYDVKKNRLLDTFEFNDKSYEVATAIYSDYLNDDTFLLIASNGDIFTIKIDSVNKYNVNYIGTIPIFRENIADVQIVDNNIYILSRTAKNKYNENPLNNGLLYTIKLDKKLATGEITSLELEEDIIPVSLILDSNRNVSILTISGVLVDGNYVNTYSTNHDKFYLSYLPSANSSYNILDLNTYSILRNDLSVVNIPTDYIETEDTIFLSKVSSKYDINAKMITGVPFFINEATNSMLLSTSNLEYVINKKYNNSPIYSINEEDLIKDFGEYEMSLVSFKSINHDEYIGLINTSIGTVGITKSGEYKRLYHSGLTMPIKSGYLVFTNNHIRYAKTV